MPCDNQFIFGSFLWVYFHFGSCVELHERKKKKKTLAVSSRDPVKWTVFFFLASSSCFWCHFKLTVIFACAGRKFCQPVSGRQIKRRDSARSNHQQWQIIMFWKTTILHCVVFVTPTKISRQKPQIEWNN